jgi:hypothetical protein
MPGEDVRMGGKMARVREDGQPDRSRDNVAEP